MVICQRLVRANYLMKIGIHQLVNNVHIIKDLSFWGSNDVSDGDNL